MSAKVQPNSAMSYAPMFNFYALFTRSPKTIFSPFLGNITPAYVGVPGATVVALNATVNRFYIPRALVFVEYTLAQNMTFDDTVRPGESLTESYFYECDSRYGPIFDYDGNAYTGRHITSNASVAHDVTLPTYSTTFTTSLSSTECSDVAQGEKITFAFMLQILEGSGNYSITYEFSAGSFLTFNASETLFLAKTSDLNSVIALPVGTLFTINGNKATLNFGSNSCLNSLCSFPTNPLLR